MKNKHRIVIFIACFINWIISFNVTDAHQYSSALILVISLSYLLMNAKEISGCKCYPIDLSRPK